MIDGRIHTFLKLCELKNYRKTAEALSMTQPAVTQHIHFLEDVYGCKLFEYKDRTLFKTPQCEMLEKHALAVVYNEEIFKREISKDSASKISVGATKTVGDYLVPEMLEKILPREDVEFELIVDNTKRLFEYLHALKLNILMIEGYFDKAQYGYKLIKKEELVGICGKSHPFAGKEVELSKIFDQHIILREQGSGTRGVFESFLAKSNHTTGSFQKHSSISSFAVIEKIVSKNLGVSFVYESIPKQSDTLATFKIKNEKISHEFNYVYLKNANVQHILDVMEI